MSDCSHDCSSCGSDCDERTEPQSLMAKPHPESSVRKIIGIVSGKGGVGKSLVTGLLAAETVRRGLHAAILDADITGPSIPKAFGITQKAQAVKEGILPIKSAGGVDIMSINLLLEDTTDPVIWRGPIIGGTVKQFWTDVIWKDVDVLYVDMPPGTGDVPLTVFQSLPIDGIIVVASPQELVSLIVAKAVKMAQLMAVPIIGLVENMSYVECPDCGKKLEVFGKSHIDEVSAEYDIPVLARIPIESKLSEAVDSGRIEEYEQDWLKSAVDKINEL